MSLFISIILKTIFTNSEQLGGSKINLLKDLTSDIYINKYKIKYTDY